MSKDLQLYNFEGNEVRVIADEKGEPWFVGNDVCNVLGLDNTAIRRLDDDEKGLRSIQTLGGLQQLGVVNEIGLYSLILGSKKSEAKRFKRWVTHEVLPRIHKTGGYVMGEENMEPEQLAINTIQMLLNKLDEKKRELEAAQDLIEYQTPIVDHFKQFLDSGDCMSIGNFAKLLYKYHKMDVGQNRAFDFLRDMGVLQRRGTSKNIPYQIYMKYFKVIKNNYISAQGYACYAFKTLVRADGIPFLVNLFLDNYPDWLNQEQQECEFPSDFPGLQLVD